MVAVPVAAAAGFSVNTPFGHVASLTITMLVLLETAVNAPVLRPSTSNSTFESSVYITVLDTSSPFLLTVTVLGKYS